MKAILWTACKHHVYIVYEGHMKHVVLSVTGADMEFCIILPRAKLENLRASTYCFKFIAFVKPHFTV